MLIKLIPKTEHAHQINLIGSPSASAPAAAVLPGGYGDL
jgi:hypothetical protein